MRGAAAFTGGKQRFRAVHPLGVAERAPCARELRPDQAVYAAAIAELHLAARPSRSSLLSGVNGEKAMGKRPASGRALPRTCAAYRCAAARRSCRHAQESATADHRDALGQFPAPLVGSEAIGELV